MDSAKAYYQENQELNSYINLCKQFNVNPHTNKEGQPEYNEKHHLQLMSKVIEQKNEEFEDHQRELREFKSTEAKEIKLEDFKVLTLRPGDVLIYQTDRILSLAAIDVIKNQIRREFPNHRCLVICGGKLGVIRTEINGTN